MTASAPSVVLCEDDPGRRAAVRELLTRAGCSSVSDVSTLTELRAALVDRAPDVIVLDLALTGLAGLEVIGGLRRTCPTSEVIVLSDYPALHDDAVAAGARAHVDVRDLRELLTVVAALRMPQPRVGERTTTAAQP